jgi:ABC-2 type transport system permease protein
MGTALAVRQRESVIGMNQLLVLPGVFLSTAFMPADLLPGWIANVARYNPVNWAVVASHEALLASQPDWGIVLIRTGSLTLFSIAAVLLGTTSFRSYQRST